MTLAAPIQANPLAIMSIRLVGTAMIIYGLGILTIAPTRWSSGAYAMVVSLAPQPVWGSVIAVLGAMILTGSLTRVSWCRNLGLYGTAVWLAAFAGSVVSAALRNPTVSWTGTVLLVLLAVIACILARYRERV